MGQRAEALDGSFALALSNAGMRTLGPIQCAEASLRRAMIVEMADAISQVPIRQARPPMITGPLPIPAAVLMIIQITLEIKPASSPLRRFGVTLSLYLALLAIEFCQHAGPDRSGAMTSVMTGAPDSGR